MSKRSSSGDVKMTRTVSVGPIKSRAKQMYKKPLKASKGLKSLIKKTISQLAEKCLELILAQKEHCY